MRSGLNHRTVVGLARLSGLGGAMLALTGIASTLFLWWLTPPGDTVSETLRYALLANTLLVSLALLGVLASRRPLLSALVLFVAFVCSFVAAFGWYFLLMPSPLALIGCGSFLYLVSAGLMGGAALRRSPRREAG